MEENEQVHTCTGYTHGWYCGECLRCMADDERGDAEGAEARK